MNSLSVQMVESGMFRALPTAMMVPSQRPRSFLKSLLYKVIQKVSTDVQATLPQESLTEMVVEKLLAGRDLGKLSDVIAFAGDLRNSIEPLKCKINVLKKPTKPETRADAAFASFTDLLKASLPPLPADDALRFASLCDDYRGLMKLPAGKGSAAQVRRHFAVSSSSGRKVRLLAAAVQAFEPRLALELGTAYGISGFFIANVMRHLTDATERRLVTVEGFEPQATLSRTLLHREFGEQVVCEFGLSYDALPRLSQSLNDIDFYFHDAGHTYDDYVNDVTRMLPKMASGSVLLLDDIRWDDRRFTDQPSRAYEGWQAIVANPRTRAAAEIDGELGIAVFS